ncbi:MAG: hypothetical protein IJW82_01425 [Clostridia bacterium]|nr:hypothetical protein [Clostridia bacterium]
MKKYFLLILLLLAGAFLTGCAEVTFEVKSSAKGEITQTLIVKPDYELLDQNGYSKETVNERIITIFNSVIKSQEDQFKAHNLFTMTLSQQKEILSKVKHNYKFDSQNNTIILSNHFDTYTDYIYYYCLVEEVLTDTDNLEKNPFFYTSINQSNQFLVR